MLFLCCVYLCYICKLQNTINYIIISQIIIWPTSVENCVKKRAQIKQEKLNWSKKMPFFFPMKMYIFSVRQEMHFLKVKLFFYLQKLKNHYVFLCYVQRNFGAYSNAWFTSIYDSEYSMITFMGTNSEGPFL